MTNERLVTSTTQTEPILYLTTQPTIATQKKRTRTPKKVVLECPRCCWIFEVGKPDSQHPDCTFNQPSEAKIKGNIIEEPRVCRNPKCKKQFTIYWAKLRKD